MSCQIIKDPVTDEPLHVFAPNGNASILFKNAYDLTQDATRALDIWATAYAPDFKLKYGDWERGESAISLDANGEPLIESVAHTLGGIMDIIARDMKGYKDFQRGNNGFKPIARVNQFRADFAKKHPDIKSKVLLSYGEPGYSKVDFEITPKAIDRKSTLSKEQLEERKNNVEKLMAHLITKFPGLSYQWVSASSLKQEEHSVDVNSINAYVKNNKIYLVNGRVDPNIGIEEFMHVFVELLRTSRPELFTGLFNSASKDPKYNAFYVSIRNWHQDRAAQFKGQDLDKIIKSEFLAKILGSAMRDEMIQHPEGRPMSQFAKLIQRFLDWIAKLVNMNTVKPETTIGEIVGYLNSKDLSMELPTSDYMYYNADQEVPEGANYDPDDSVYREILQEEEEKKAKQSAKERNIKMTERDNQNLREMRDFLIKSPYRSKQVAVVDKLIENGEQKLIRLNNDQETVSATTYIGSYNTEIKNQKATDIAANFGNFFHEMLNDIQIAYMRSGDSPAVIYNKELETEVDGKKVKSSFFDQFFEKHKDMIQYDTFDKQMLRDIGARLISTVDSYLLGDNILLPEISLAVEDVDGKIVLGRIDLMVVDPDGKALIIDLKTKKIIGSDFDNGRFPAREFSQSYDITHPFKPGVDPLFAEFKNRSALQKYQMQTALYQEMANSLGITVKGRMILAIAYMQTIDSTDPDNPKYGLYKYGVGSFSDHDFYRYDSKGKITNISDIANAIDQVARARFRTIEEIEQEKEKHEKEAKNNNPFALIDEYSKDVLISNLTKLVDEQMSRLDEEKNAINKNEGLTADERSEQFSKINRRKANLTSIKSTLEQTIKGEDPESIAAAKALVIKSAIDTLSYEVGNISEKIREIDVPKSYTLHDAKNNDVLRKLKNHVSDLDNINEYLRLFTATIRSNVTDPQVVKDIELYLGAITSNISAASSTYIGLSKDVVKSIIKDQIGTETFSKVMGDMKKILTPQRDALRREIEGIKSGQKSQDGFLWKTAKLVSRLINGVKEEGTQLEILEKRLRTVEKLMEVNELNDKTIDEYLGGLLHSEESIFYLGQTMSGADSDSAISIDSLYSNASSSELLVSAMFNYMRNTVERGRSRFFNEFAYPEGHIRTEFIDARGIEGANNAIQEEVDEAVEFDEEGKASKTEKNRQFISPHQKQFETDYDSYKVRLAKLDEQYRDLNKQSRFATPEEKVEIDAKKKKLSEEHKRLGAEFVEFQITHTQTKVLPEVMRLMYASGGFNVEITERFEKIHSIISSAGGEHMLTDDQQYEIDKLNVEISTIVERMRTEATPEEKEKLDKLLTYFDYDLNFTLWEKKRTSMLAQCGGNENHPHYLRWLENNSDIVPKQDFWDQLEAINDQIDAITGGKDPALDVMFKRLKEIKNKYKVRGKFSYSFMSPEDVTEYEKITEEVEEYYDSLSLQQSKFSAEEFRELGRLGAEKRALKKTVYDPKYVRDRNRLRNNVINAYKTVQDLKLKIEESEDAQERREAQLFLEEAEKQYAIQENIFKEFFDKNNKTTYTFGMIKDRLDLNEHPKSFIYVTVPTDANMLERVPNKNYRLKRLKDSALNPDYQDSFVPQRHGSGFYPMLKGVHFNKSTMDFEITGSNKYLNPDFTKLKNDKLAYEFYQKWVVKNFLMKQELAEGRPLGFNLPFQRPTSFENIMSKGVSGVASDMKQKLQDIAYNNSDYERATNISGKAGKDKIAFPENYRTTADLTTKNGIEAIFAWNGGFYINKELAQSSVETSSVIDWLKNRRDWLGKEQVNESRQLTNIISQLEFEQKKFMYGQLYKKGDDESSVFNRKTFRMMMHLASMGRMAFDIPMQVGNLFAGSVQSWLSTSQSRHADSTNYTVGYQLLVTRFLPKLIADFGKVDDVSLETKIYRAMNPSSKNLTKLLQSNTVSAIRRAAGRVFNFGDLGMMGQDGGEFVIGMQMMLMIMDHKKFEVYETDENGNVKIEDGVKVIKKDAEGNTVYAKAYEVWKEDKNGALVLRDDVNVTQKEIDVLKGIIWNEIEHAQGNYAHYTQPQFSSTILGSLTFFYRKYLLPAISVRFGFGGFQGVGSAYRWSAQESYMGWYTALYKMFKYYGVGTASKALLYDTFIPGMLKTNDSNMPKDEALEYYRGRSVMAVREMLFAVACYLTYEALRAALYNGDDDDLSYSELMLMRSLVKVTNESRSLVPLPIVGKASDYIDNFSQLTSALKEGKTLWSLGENALWYTGYNLFDSEFAYERGFYQRATDMYEAGDPKVLKNFSDLTGLSNIQDQMSREAALNAAKRVTRNK